MEERQARADRWSEGAQARMSTVERFAAAVGKRLEWRLADGES